MRPDGDTLVPGGLVAWPAAAALVAEGVAWCLLLGGVPSAWYGLPHVLAAIHLLVLGALGVSVVAYGWQLVPVVTAQAPPGWWSPLARAVNGGLVVGVATLCAGMALLPSWLAVAGGALVALSLVVRSAAVTAVLIRASGRVAQRLWLIAAELCLLAGLGLGALLLSGRMGAPVLESPLPGISWHASVLLLGWIGGWVAGVGSILLPMFAVAPPPRSWALGAAGLAWYAGLALGAPWIWAAGAVLLLGGFGHSLARRVGAPSAGVWVAGLGLSGLLVVAALALRSMGAAAVVAIIALVALPVLRGVSLRIGPFLVWAHQLAGFGARAPAVASLVPGWAPWVAGPAALVAGALVVLGVALDARLATVVGAGIAVVGVLTQAGVLGGAWVRAVRARARLDAIPGMEVS